MKLSRLCSCGRIVKGRCEICQQAKAAKADDYRAPFREVYPKGWDELSVIYRAENPLCEHCLQKGFVTPAKDTHHKIKITQRPDLALDRSNLMAVCRKCHSELDRKSSDGRK